MSSRVASGQLGATAIRRTNCVYYLCGVVDEVDAPLVVLPLLPPWGQGGGHVVETG